MEPRKERTMTTYITFGQDHRHEIGDDVFDKDCVAVIPSDTQEEGRKIAFDIFGGIFCFEYYNEVPNMDYFPRGLIAVSFPMVSDGE